MILKSIRLDNIRSYTRQKIDFPKGSLLLSGDIGSGKSTILYAVEFALFGIMRSELSGSSLLRNGEREGSVELELDVNNKDIIIKRSLKRYNDGIKQSQGYIIHDGMKTELTPIELKTRILEMLGYPLSLVTRSKSLIYRYTVYTPQEQMKHILFDDRESRLDILRKVFGIDKYKRVRENSMVFVHDLKNEAKRFEGIAEGLELKRKELEEYGHEIAELRIRINEEEPKVNSLKSKRQAKEKELLACENKIKKLDDIRKKLEVNRAKAAEKRDAIERLSSEIEKTMKEIEEYEHKIRALDVSRFTKTKEDIEENMKRREEKINYVRSKRAELSEKHRFMEESIKGIMEEIRRKTETAYPLEAKTEELKELVSKVEDKEPIKARIEDNQKKLMEINLKIKEQETRIKGSGELKDKIGSIDQCPTCLQPVSTEHKHAITCTENEKIDSCRSIIEDCMVNKREIEAVDNALKEELEKINTREKSIEKLKAEIRSIHDIKDDIAEKQKQQNRMELETESIKNALDKLHAFDLESHEKALAQEKEMLKKLSEKSHIEDMIKEKKKAAEASSLAGEEAKKLIAGLEERNKMLAASIDRGRDTEESFRRAKHELDSVREEEKKTEISLAAVAKEAEAKEDLLKGIEQEAVRKLEAKSMLGNTRILQNWMEEHFISLMNTMERQVMMRIYNEFNEMFQTWFNMLIEQETLAVRLDDQFTPVIEQNGYETGIEALSGGEKTAVALAYRLALNKVINDIVGDIKTKDLIILDEPTDGFSSQQLDKLKDVIDQLGLKQVIIVSHEPKIESFVDNVVKLSKNEHVTQVL